jgi:hypothetical protein
MIITNRQAVQRYGTDPTAAALATCLRTQAADGSARDGYDMSGAGLIIVEPEPAGSRVSLSRGAAVLATISVVALAFLRR